MKKEETKDFSKPISQELLNLETKSRSNLFAWRGQFSPLLIENLLSAYCPEGSTVLDPFCGSGTVIAESAARGLDAIGVELNPAAYALSRVYELATVEKEERKGIIESFLQKIEKAFPFTLDSTPLENVDISKALSQATTTATPQEKILADALLILLDLKDKSKSNKDICATAQKLASTATNIPQTKSSVSLNLGDCRELPIQKNTVDFILTSPPYINVFNYHQNYRGSAELLGWNLLKIAKSEIGSNRANRGNRFLTVSQYCKDMAKTLTEIRRVCKKDARIIFIVGHESRVLGAPFYNAELIEDLATKTNLFQIVLRQTRNFTNKFGQDIREDLLHLIPTSSSQQLYCTEKIANEVATEALSQALKSAPEKNKDLLMAAISTVEKTQGIPVYKSHETNKNFNLAKLA